MGYFEKFNDNEVVSLKMISGEEVIARIVKFDADGIVVSKPASLAQTPDGKLTLAPFSICGDLETEGLIFRSAIMLVSRPRQEMEAKYNEATSAIHRPVGSSKILLS